MGPQRRRSSNDAAAVAAADCGASLSQRGLASRGGPPWRCGPPRNGVCLYAAAANPPVGSPPSSSSTSSSAAAAASEAAHAKSAITLEDLKAGDVVKLRCSNEGCQASPYMHLACFDSFEETVLAHLRGRGWSSSDKLRAQNLWTANQGYELVYKVCECSCGHGYLRKDIDWTPPAAMAAADEVDNNVEDERAGGVGWDQDGDGAAGCGVAEDPAAPGLAGSGPQDQGGARRKRKKSKSQGKPTITIGLPAFGSGGVHHHHHHNQHNHHHQQQQQQQHHHHHHFGQQAAGAGSGSSGPAGASASGQASTAKRTTSLTSSEAQLVLRNRTNSVSSSGSSGSNFSSSSPADFSSASPSSTDGGGILHPPRRVLLQDRSRHDSGGSIFQRRQDYSSFNVLPKHKINSYHIKMEDECSIGNDETRIFILSSYATNKMNRVPCVVCKSHMIIYDRYPLVDGTFFLSPKQHTKTCVQVKLEGKTSFLTAVCMSCLEGWTGGGILCRFCLKVWSGGHLVLGTMYSYDIFAAIPCCAERFKCHACNQLVCHPEQRFNFFSDYSQMISCPNCGTQDAHFVKGLAMYITREEANKQIHLAQNFQQLQHHQLQQQQQQQQQPFPPLHMGMAVQAGAAAAAAVGGGLVQQQQHQQPHNLRVHRVNSA